jgi:hypothetical protein
VGDFAGSVLRFLGVHLDDGAGDKVKIRKGLRLGLKIETHLRSLYTTFLSSIVALSTSLSLDAALIYGSLETFNNIAAAGFDPFVSTGNWENSSTVANSVRGQDDGVSGNDMAGTGNDTLRIRKAAGEITFVPALTLVTDNAASLTVELDYQGKQNGNTLGIEYSALGDFSDTVNFGTIVTSDPTPLDGGTSPDTGIYLNQTFTATNGTGGIIFTDTASIRIDIIGGTTATENNGSGTFVDNISVTYIVIPEPSSAALMGVALLGLGGISLILRLRR